MAKSRESAGQGWSLTTECPKCGKHECRCAPRPAEPAGKPTVRLRLEKRKGKPVTVAAASGIASGELSLLLKEAKTLCGAGGTLREEELELQGEHRTRLRPLLEARGYLVKG